MELAKRGTKLTPIVSNLDVGAWESYKEANLKGCTDSEIHLFKIVAERSGLDPMLKQIYPVKRFDSQLRKEVMTVQTSIDGFRSIAERTGNYAPGKEPSYTYDQTGALLSATAYVRKRTEDGAWHDVAATAFFEEYVQTTKDGRPTRFWAKMPHGQLAKCAEALALRKAFPNQMSKIYAAEEMNQADTDGDVDVKPSVVSIPNDKVLALESMIAGCGDVTQANIYKYMTQNFRTNDVRDLSINNFESLYSMVKQRYDKWVQINAIRDSEGEVDETGISESP